MDNNAYECQCVDQYKDKLYILTRKNNMLLEYNLISNELVLISKLKELYCSSCRVDNKIIYFPANSNDICEYNIEENTINYISIIVEGTSRPFKECWNCVLWDGYIYITCGSGSIPLVKMDAETYRAVDISKWNDLIKKDYGIQAVNRLWKGIGANNDRLWFSINVPDVIVEYNLLDYSYTIHRLKTKNIVFHTINIDGNNIWLTGESETIFKWNIVDDSIEEYTALPDNFEYLRGTAGWPGAFYCGIQDVNTIMFIPLEGNMIIKIEKNTGEISKIGMELDNKYSFHAFPLSDGRIYMELDDIGSENRSDSVMIGKDNVISKFEFSKEELRLSKLDKAKVLNYGFDEVLFEENKAMLSDYIRMIRFG